MKRKAKERIEQKEKLAKENNTILPVGFGKEIKNKKNKRRKIVNDDNPLKSFK